MPDKTPAGWYDHPHYYDIVFDGDTAREVDFLEGVFAVHGPRTRRRRVLEPACGSGRTVAEFVRRGWRATGFDLNERMLDYARRRLGPVEMRRARLFRARLEAFPPCGRFELAHCLLSTFKYVLTGRGAASHLRRVAEALVPGGLYVLGVHLTDYRRRTIDREIWHGARDGVRVSCETVTWPADRRTRREPLSNRLAVEETGPDGRIRRHRVETRWECRTYDAGQLRRLLGRVPALEVVACHDFNHDLSQRRQFDDAQEDLVLVLRRRPAAGPG